MIDQTRPEPDHKKTGVNYERLGKAVEDALILDYIYVLHSTRRQVWSAFIRGAFAGIGGVLGATVGVGVLVALLQLFGGTPVIGQFFQDLGQTIENRHQ
jgi:hypothetical protein